ncbi:MAG: hypothetical protein LAP21_12620 [Acidobacteriia bacterium]|nr:hypothetical protein [Terriglobia bacterium]
MAAVKKSVWSLGYRIAGVIVFLFSFLHLSPPSWARSMATANARSNSNQALKPEPNALMDDFLRESRFSNQEISALIPAERLLLAQAGKSTTSSRQPKTKQDQPPQAVKLKQTGQPKQAMKLNQPNQAMKLNQTDQPKQAMKLNQPNQAVKLNQTDQPKQAMKLNQPNQAMKLKQNDQPKQAMKLKQGSAKQ